MTTSVTRRFSDFLGLHEKLVEKHSHVGRIIPPAPEKNLVGTTKAKFGGGGGGGGEANGSASAAAAAAAAANVDDASNQTTEFVNRRRMALERFTNRVVSHPILREGRQRIHRNIKIATSRVFLAFDLQLPAHFALTRGKF